MYVYIYISICQYTYVQSKIRCHSSIYLYINAYLQGIILIKKALSGLKVVKVTLHDYIILGTRRTRCPHRVIKQAVLLAVPAMRCNVL